MGEVPPENANLKEGAGDFPKARVYFPSHTRTMASYLTPRVHDTLSSLSSFGLAGSSGQNSMLSPADVVSNPVSRLDGL